ALDQRNVGRVRTLGLGQADEGRGHSERGDQHATPIDLAHVSLPKFQPNRSAGILRTPHFPAKLRLLRPAPSLGSVALFRRQCYRGEDWTGFFDTGGWHV